MAILTTGYTFTATQQVTSSNLNAIANNAAFVSGSSGTTDDSTLEVNVSGRLQAKDGGITASKLSTNSVSTVKVVDLAITTAKINDLAVTTGKINDSAVTSDKINDTAVTTAKLANDAVTFAKMQNSAAGSSLVGRPTGSSGDFSEVTLNSTLAFSGSTLQRAALTGDVTAPAGSNVTTIAVGAVETTMIADGAISSGSAVFSAGHPLWGPEGWVELFGMTQTTRDSLTPTWGTVVYNLTTHKLNVYTPDGWEVITSA